MHRIILILLFALIVLTKPFDSFAQSDGKEEEPKPKMKFRDRIFVGGGVQLSFGTVTVIGASPIVGYRITDKWSAGIGINYIYYRQKFQNNSIYKTNIYGGNVFTRYTIWKNLFAHGEYGFTNWEIPEVDLYGHYTGNTRRINSYSMPLGGGYAQPIGRNSYFEILALYDVLYNPATSFSGSPLTFRAGVNVGF